MSVLTLSDITKSFGMQTVLSGVSFQFSPGEKAGLIGPNGSGKSTLLKIIKGKIETDRGSVHLNRQSSIGYLPQEPRPIGKETLRSLLEHSLQDLFHIKENLHVLEKKITSCSNQQQTTFNCSKQSTDNNHDRELAKMLEEYDRLRVLFEDKGGYQIEGRILSVTQGLGFNPEELERNTSHFSGGEIMRARLATLLLQEPDFLLLDEPTNFLDVYGLEWLEKYLREWSGALLVVSHDRFFLDRVVDHIFYLQNGKIKKYRGNYSSFIQQKTKEDLSLYKAYTKSQDKIKKEEKLIRESKADERSKRQAQSRQKRLEKLETVEPPEKIRSFKPNFSYGSRSGHMVISMEDISKYFGEQEVLRDITLEIHWGDRVALVGPNGSGKTTLLKMIAGEAKPSTGWIRWGPSVQITYFSQEQDELDLERTVLGEITETSQLNPKEARNHLGRYLFQGEDVFKSVKCLSSGEKSRLALAKLALGEGNFLLMDEPTSHLDLPALEELEQALKNYPGTLVVISHDRYFLSTLVNRIIELHQGKAYLFHGSYEEYLKKRRENLQAQATPPTPKNNHTNPHHQKLDQKQKIRQAQNRQKKLKEKQAHLETLIYKKEKEVESLERKLSDPQLYGNYSHVEELSHQLQQAKDNAGTLLKHWEEISLELESVEQFLDEYPS